jgi:YqaJ-like viral recombinase domain
MIAVDCRQGTPEWYQARCGVITASEFETSISKLKRASGDKKVGDFTDASDKYLCTVAAESINGKTFGQPVKAWVLDRGHELEDYARLKYMERTGSVVYSQGVCLTDDKYFGYSTDGEVDDDGLIEVKCPIDLLKIMTFLVTQDHSEYGYQIQGGLWITGRKWCDLLMYAPMLENTGNDLIVKRIYRDEEFIESMVNDLFLARQRVEKFIALFSKPQLKAA